MKCPHCGTGKLWICLDGRTIKCDDCKYIWETTAGQGGGGGC